VVTYRALHTRIVLRVVAASLTTYSCDDLAPARSDHDCPLTRAAPPVRPGAGSEPIAIAVLNPVYPERSAVDHDHAFDSMMRELALDVAVRQPSGNRKSWMATWPERSE